MVLLQGKKRFRNPATKLFAIQLYDRCPLPLLGGKKYKYKYIAAICLLIASKYLEGRQYDDTYKKFNTLNMFFLKKSEAVPAKELYRIERSLLKHMSYIWAPTLLDITSCVLNDIWTTRNAFHKSAEIREITFLFYLIQYDPAFISYKNSIVVAVITRLYENRLMPITQEMRYLWSLTPWSIFMDIKYGLNCLLDHVRKAPQTYLATKNLDPQMFTLFSKSRFHF